MKTKALPPNTSGLRQHPIAHCFTGSGFATTSLGGMRVTFRRRMMPSKGVLFGKSFALSGPKLCAALMPFAGSAGKPFSKGVRSRTSLLPGTAMDMKPLLAMRARTLALPASNVSAAMAVASFVKRSPVPQDTVVIGELGLAGEVRPAPRGQERLREAAKLGFSVAVVPKANAPKKPIEGLTIHAVERIEEAMEAVRGL